MSYTIFIFISCSFLIKFLKTKYCFTCQGYTASLLLLMGCAGKADFSKNVSAEDKALFSSYGDKVLYVFKNDIRITKKGFYPNYQIPSHPIREGHKRYNDKYFSNVSSYLGTKKFNMQTFMDDVNQNNLKFYRQKMVAYHKKYPLFLMDKVDLKEIGKMKSSKDFFSLTGLDCVQAQALNEETQLSLLQNDAHLVKCIENPTEQAQLLILEKKAYLLTKIQHLTPKVEKLAIDKYPSLSSRIQNLSDETRLYVKVKDELTRQANKIQEEHTRLKDHNEAFDPNQY